MVNTEPAIAPEMGDENTDITPMMQQYLLLKKRHPQEVVLFRLGDFYELFFNDAVQVSKLLDLTLTQRGKHMGEPVPMCGIPFHQLENYLPRMIKQGLRIAIAEQTETPQQAKKRGKSTLVERKISRIVTPGTLLEDAALTPAHHYLLALSQQGQTMAAAWVDVSTGELWVRTFARHQLPSLLCEIQPSEIVVSEKLIADHELKPLLNGYESLISIQPDSRFYPQTAEMRLKEIYRVDDLAGLNLSHPAAMSAVGAALDYVALTQQNQLPVLQKPRTSATQQSLHMDVATRRNLELTQRLNGSTDGSVLSVINHTQTSAGFRLLSEWLNRPSADLAAIQLRADAVAYFKQNTSLRHQLQGILQYVLDSARALSRLTADRGGPRDLKNIQQFLQSHQQLSDLLRAAGEWPTLLQQQWQQPMVFELLANTLQRALMDDVPLLLRDGGFVRHEFDGALDAQRQLKDNAQAIIQELQTRYAAHTNVPSLKIRFNHILGYFIEVTPQHKNKIGTEFIHRQTLASALRFTTPELMQWQEKILAASDEALQRELAIFAELTQLVRTHANQLQQAIEAVALLDVVTALADVAQQFGWVRPQLDAGLHFYVVGGRHPVVEHRLKRLGSSFIANDCQLSSNETPLLLTGPNMAGKSTYLRQNALIVILAHMGSFVPAVEAHMGLVDQLFCRVGAADDLAEGRSTFMVEMLETASILNQATQRSFVVFDELGRGTATVDGLAIATACLEFLHNVLKCRCLFATHYLELTMMSDRLPHMRNAAVQVAETDSGIVFLHSVKAGAADRAYGVHVAQLAGLPDAVIERASQLLPELEATFTNHWQERLKQDLPLFDTPMPAKPVRLSRVEQALQQLDPDELSPRAALDELFRLKKMLSSV